MPKLRAGLIVLVFLAGCASADYFSLAFLESSATGRDRVVVGSLEAVSANTQATLKQLGLQAVATQDGEAVRIRSMTRNGQLFSLVLTSERTAQGEQTHIRLEWEGSPDHSTGAQILTEVTAQGQTAKAAK